jgi:hypothetical protein
MESDLLDNLLSNIGVPAVEYEVISNKPSRRFSCDTDYHTWYPYPVRRIYGEYVRPVPREVTVCDSLCINNDQKEYEEMITDMTRMSLARSRGLMAEKRFSSYERKQKLSK